MVLGAVKGRARARAPSGFIPCPLLRAVTAGCLSGRRAVPTVSTAHPAGRTKGCRKNLPNDPRLENGETGAQAERETSPWPPKFLALNYGPVLCGRSAKVRIKQRLSLQKDTCQGQQS